MSVLTSLLLAFALYNFPWITKYWRISTAKLSIGRGDSVAFVSDVHIGSSGFSLKARSIGRILRRLKVGALVIVGDLIDRRLSIDLKGLERIAELAANILDIRDTTIIYIASSSAHDVVVRGFENGIVKLKLRSRGVDFLYTVNPIDLAFDGCRERVYAMHGDYVSRDGTVSYLVDRVGRRLFKTALTGLAARKILGLGDRYWVILGHSHVSYIDRKHRVAVLGSWVRRLYAPRESSIAITTCSSSKLNVMLAKFD